MSLLRTAYGAAPDVRSLLPVSQFSWDWNLVDFGVYLIRYLEINQLTMAFSGIEPEIQLGALVISAIVIRMRMRMTNALMRYQRV